MEYHKEKMIMKTKLAIVMVLLLAACSSLTAPLATPTATVGTVVVLPPKATLPPLDLTPSTPAANEIASLSGSAPATGKPFTITANSLLRVNWQQASTGDFVLAVTNTDPSQAGTANGRVMFESITGPSAMFSDYEFIPGQYQIAVESADGPWKVWVEYIGPGE
jgi:hypothetical protein